MPDALATMMNLQSPSNRTPGGGGGMSTYQPNVMRNNAKVDALRRLLGISGQDDGSIAQADYEGAFDEQMADQEHMLRAEAEADVLPERVRGEYGLESERIRGQSNLGVARMNRDAAHADKDALYAQQEYLTRLRGEITGENQHAAQEATAGRASAAQAAQAGRAQQTDKYRQAAELRKQAQGVNPLMNMITGKREKLMQQAEALTRQSDPVSVVAELLQSPKYQGKSLQELIQILQPESDEDMQQLQQAYAMIGGQ